MLLILIHYIAYLFSIGYGPRPSVLKVTAQTEINQTDPKILCLKPHIVMGKFNGIVLAQKNAKNTKKGKRLDFQTLKLFHLSFLFIVTNHYRNVLAYDVHDRERGGRQ